MPSRVTLSAQTNKPYVPTSHYEEDPVYALLKIDPMGTQAMANPFGGRSSLNLVLIVDSSGTMFNFQLSPEEREYWMSLAMSRDELDRGTADDRDAVYWGGQTLNEMQSVVRKPMTLAVEAIKQLLAKLESGDNVSVIAFADQTYTVFTQADWVTRPDYCLNALDDLLEQRLPYDIGTGTHMAFAINQAGSQMSQMAKDSAVNRILVLSDGIVQDRRETFEALEEVKLNGFAISTIGIGDEFDEEFLMRVADTSRGDYYYAATSDEITGKLLSELTVMKASSLHRVHIEAEGQGGAMVQDVYMVSPSMSIFDEMDTNGAVLRARIGDLQSDHITCLLFQMAPALLSAGEHPLANITLTWQETSDTGSLSAEQSATAKLSQRFSDDPTLIAQRNAEVQDFVDRFTVYKLEREAQRAQERGDIEGARQKLGAATRELQKLGETELAADLEHQMASFGTGIADPSRIKRIKATTRKLADKAKPT